MRIFAIANQKGGVGKTTTTVNIAAPLGIAGRSCLIVDLDPHGSLTSSFGLDPQQIESSSYQLFQNPNIDPHLLIRETAFDNLDILPANAALATLDRQLGASSGKGLVIVDALKKLSKEYAYVFIDCPPVLGVLMVNALAACERLLIPVQSEFLALKGLEQMVRTLTMVTHSLGKQLPYTIIPTMYDKYSKVSQTTLETLREMYPYNIWDSEVPIDPRFKEASSRGVPLTLMSPKSRGAMAYRQLLTSILRITYEYEQKTLETPL